MVKPKLLFNHYECGECGRIFSTKIGAEICCKKIKYKNWKRVKKFKLKKEHLDLLKKMRVEWDDYENGAPCINPKRPYDDDDADDDIYEVIAKVIGLDEEQRFILRHYYSWDFESRKFSPKDDEWYKNAKRYMRDLHKQTMVALQIILRCQTFKLGWYERSDEYCYDWKYIGKDEKGR